MKRSILILLAAVLFVLASCEEEILPEPSIDQAKSTEGDDDQDPIIQD